MLEVTEVSFEEKYAKTAIINSIKRSNQLSQSIRLKSENILNSFLRFQLAFQTGIQKLVSTRKKNRQEPFRSDQTKKLMTYLKLVVEGMVSVERTLQYHSVVKADGVTALLFAQRLELGYGNYSTG